MELHLTPEKEAILQQLSTRTGRPTSDLLAEAVDRLLDYDAWFIREVEKGMAQAQRGDLIDHEEVGSRIEKHIEAKQSRS